MQNLFIDGVKHKHARMYRIYNIKTIELIKEILNKRNKL